MRDVYPLSGYAHAHRKPPRTRVLVISPHPDDDVIGCGGALLRLARRGARITVVYVTDGSASHINSKRFPPGVLRDLREGEACAALGVLGIRTRPRFLRARDGTLSGLEADERQRVVTAIVTALTTLRPHLLLTPWQRDPHPDHIATAALVESARALSVCRPVTYCYGVWLPVRGLAADAPQADEMQRTTACEIALAPAELDCKRAAIMEHRSQTSDLIDDDPDGFRIDAALLAQWLQPREQFYRNDRLGSG